MIKVFRKVKQFIGRRFNKVSRQAIVSFNSEVEEIINKTLANEEIEEIIVQSVERVIFSLLRDYWIALVVLVLLLFLIQSIFLSITITILLKSMKY